MSKEDDTIYLGRWAPSWAQKLADWLHRLLERQRADRELLLSISERLGATMTKADGAIILRAVQQLREELTKPTIQFTVGKPKDKES